jgi:hypothetical protein
MCFLLVVGITNFAPISGPDVFGDVILGSGWDMCFLLVVGITNFAPISGPDVFGDVILGSGWDMWNPLAPPPPSSTIGSKLPTNT